jgi:hypothetical protein
MISLLAVMQSGEAIETGIVGAVRPMPWSLPHRRGDGGRACAIPRLVKNRILRQLSADELKSVQPWFTLQELRSNAVLHEPGDAIEHTRIGLLAQPARIVRRQPNRQHHCSLCAGLELRNVAANYPFERSHRFAGIQPKF